MARAVQTPMTGGAGRAQQARGAATGIRRAGSGSTGVADEVYGVVSVLYHALQGAQTYEQYIADAQKAGDSELEQFFQSCRSEEQQRATRAKGLLLERLDDDMEEDEDDSASSTDDDEDEE